MLVIFSECLVARKQCGSFVHHTSDNHRKFKTYQLAFSKGGPSGTGKPKHVAGPARQEEQTPKGCLCNASCCTMNNSSRRAQSPVCTVIIFGPFA